MTADERASAQTYVALLRGINLGKRRIKMADLRRVFEGLGCQDVSTLQAAGNVIFSAPAADSAALTQTLETHLSAAFGYEIPVLLRTAAAIRSLVDADPFAGIEVTPETRLYVTFLSSAPRAVPVELPYTSPDGYFRILRLRGTEVFSVLTISPEGRTVDLMVVLEQLFGDNITTRNWNTVVKIAEKLP